MQTKDDMYALAFDSSVCDPNTEYGLATRAWYLARADLLDAVLWLEEHEQDSVDSPWLVNQTAERVNRALAQLAKVGAALDACDG